MPMRHRPAPVSAHHRAATTGKYPPACPRHADARANTRSAPGLPDTGGPRCAFIRKPSWSCEICSQAACHPDAVCKCLISLAAATRGRDIKSLLPRADASMARLFILWITRCQYLSMGRINLSEGEPAVLLSRASAGGQSGCRCGPGVWSSDTGTQRRTSAGGPLSYGTGRRRYRGGASVRRTRAGSFVPIVLRG